MLRYLYYIRYFFFILWNWNVRLAIFTLFHEVRGERKYGLDTSRLNTLTHVTITGSNRQHAEVYQGASYFLLENLFARLRTLYPAQVFVDVGCGKGRALTVAAHYGFSQLTGIDFALDLCKEAAYNGKKLLVQFPSLNYRVVCADAADYVFEDNTDTIYFFNPFDRTIMQQVVPHILDSLQRKPRILFIIYINPQHKKVFLDAGFTEVYYLKKMDFVEACILKKNL